MLRGQEIEGVTQAYHHVVRQRDTLRVFEQFPDTFYGRRQARGRAHERNKDRSDMGAPYYEDHVKEGELIINGFTGKEEKHVHPN